MKNNNTVSEQYPVCKLIENTQLDFMMETGKSPSVPELINEISILFEDNKTDKIKTEAIVLLESMKKSA